MPARMYPEFETAIDGLPEEAVSGCALARIVEAHPVLALLLDFCAADPLQIAVEVGMVYPYEEGGLDDLSDIDFGPAEWFEPAAGLLLVERAIAAVRADPQSIGAAIYDPGLTPAAVLADLESIEALLQAALQHETRFHFLLTTDVTQR